MARLKHLHVSRLSRSAKTEGLRFEASLAMFPGDERPSWVLSAHCQIPPTSSCLIPGRLSIVKVQFLVM